MKARFFEKEEMVQFYRELPEKPELISDIRLVVQEKIVLMTHDDCYDEEMHEFAIERGADCTFFCLASKVKNDNNGADIQFHWNKGSHYSLKEQLQRFQDRAGFAPWANRNHRLYWRERHLDLACLAMNGIRHDSSMMGSGSYLPVVQNRVLPIVETELSLTDWPYVDVTRNAHCTYSLASDPEVLFRQGVTPLTCLFHPYLKDQARWREIYDMAFNYGYRVTSLRQYHELLADKIEMQHSFSG